MKKTIELPNKDYLESLLDYDPNTGVLTWKIRPESMFSGGKYSATRRARRWNSRYAGKEAFTHINANGYHIGSIDKVTYLAHRIIWKMTTGEDPEEIDHRDQDKINNREGNLRDVSASVNCRNRKIRHDDMDSVVGVYPRGDKFIANIKVDQKVTHLGTFETKDAAIVARKLAERANGFTSLHGRAGS